MATITSANAVLLIGINSLYATPQLIEGFATDDAFTTEAVTPVELKMGVDGVLSGGWVPVQYPMTISLQADSGSNVFFEAWAAAQEAEQDVYQAFGTIRLESISRTYILTNGFLSSYTPLPPVKKTLEARTFTITWNSIVGAPI